MLYRYKTCKLVLVIQLGVNGKLVKSYIHWGRHVVWGVGLRLLVCWDCGFESRLRHGCLSVMNVVCCHRGVCDRPAHYPEEFCEECVLLSSSVIMCYSNPLHLHFVGRTGWTKKERKIIYPLWWNQASLVARMSVGSVFPLCDWWLTDWL
jgi:hypothetical protein